MSTQVKTLSLYASRPRRTSAWTWLRAAMATRRSRNDLRSLDAHILNDIGLTDVEAHKEADRPVWDVPGHWIK